MSKITSASLPWHFDGHGLNDGEGQRVATFTDSLKRSDVPARLERAVNCHDEAREALEWLINCYTGGVKAKDAQACGIIEKARAVLAKMGDA